MEESSGPSHEPIWTVHCKSKLLFLSAHYCIAYHVHQVGGEIKGTGVAVQKAQAKQAAAKEALQVRFPLHGLSAFGNDSEIVQGPSKVTAYLHFNPYIFLYHISCSKATRYTQIASFIITALNAFTVHVSGERSFYRTQSEA